MKAKRIEVHISKGELEIAKTIEAFDRTFYFRSIVSTDINSKDVIAVYLPKEDS